MTKYLNPLARKGSRLLVTCAHISESNSHLLKKSVCDFSDGPRKWLRLRTPNAGGPGYIPGQATRSDTPQKNK